MNFNISAVDSEIREIVGDLESMKINTKNDYSSIDDFVVNEVETDRDDANEYQNGRDTDLSSNQFKLKFGSCDGFTINQYSCVCNKANIAMRKAIKGCKKM